MSKILIIEDEVAIADLEKDYLELSDFKVDICNTGDEGLKTALAGDYDLIILDLMLPGMDGFEVCKKIREEKNIPILMVSAKKDDIDKIRGLGLGADDYLVKPFTYERFQQALDTFCRHRDAVAGDAVEQSALDRLFSPALPAEHQPPKGLQESTLELVRACLRAAPPQGLPSETISRQTGLSAVTVRRYVNYLVERGEASSTVNYDTGGRPCRLYRPSGRTDL